MKTKEKKYLNETMLKDFQKHLEDREKSHSTMKKCHRDLLKFL